MPDPSELPASAAIPAPPDELYPNPPLLDYAGIPPEALDEQQRIACDLPCRNCGYNLQTIHSRADCPECGTAAHWSLVGDLLRFADADWVQKLSRGMLLMLLSIVISFLAGFAVSFIGAFMLMFMLTNVLIIVISVGSVLVMAYGEWLLTTPEPQPEGLPTQPAGVRGTARWLLMTGAAAGLIALLVQSTLIATTADTWALNPMYTVAEGFDLISSLTGIVGLFCLAVLLRRYALRAPHEGIARQTKIVTWGWAILLGLVLVGVLLMAVIQFFSPNNAGTSVWDNETAMIALGCGGGSAGLVLGIWSLILMIRYRNLFNRHAGYARFRIPEHRPPRL
ncbi:MAG: hypothetical protein AAF593_12480 [Planctomycetota bacterium]